MDSIIAKVVIAVIALAIGALIGYIDRKNVGEKAIGSAEQKARNLILDAENKSETMKIDQLSTGSFLRKLDSMETNVISKITDVLSEKLDGLDEVIVELIKAKTENETLRQKVNELNKENFSLKSENASYKPVGLGFYVKKSTDDFTF